MCCLSTFEVFSVEPFEGVFLAAVATVAPACW